MKFILYKVSGYEEAIMSLRMSTGKYYSWETAQAIQDLVYVCTDKRGFLADRDEYMNKIRSLKIPCTSDYKSLHPKITGDYEKDIAEFKRLLGLVMNQAMGEFDHHTLMKYIDVSFFTEGLHRGAQDDLDSHAIGFNNRITRYSTRLAEIPEPKLSEWYQDKIIPFHEIQIRLQNHEDPDWSGTEWGMPPYVRVGNEKFIYSPFGYIHEKYAGMAKNNGLYKDVQRGLIPLGQESNALWKSDLFNLRYIYFRRSKLTKANPELKLGMEMLADQIEKHIPVFGEKFRYELTDTGQWEHVNKVRTVTAEEYRLLCGLKEKPYEGV